MREQRRAVSGTRAATRVPERMDDEREPMACAGDIRDDGGIFGGRAEMLVHRFGYRRLWTGLRQPRQRLL
jgi:hypothetical protein